MLLSALRRARIRSLSMGIEMETMTRLSPPEEWATREEDWACEGCGKRGHRDWVAVLMPNCGRKRCLVRMVVRRAGFEVGAFSPTSAAAAGLNHLLKSGYMRKSGWRVVIPTVETGAVFAGLIREVKLCEEREGAGIPVPVEEFVYRIRNMTRSIEQLSKSD